MTDDFKDEIRGRMEGRTPPRPVYDVESGSYPLDKQRGVDVEQVEEGGGVN